MAEQDILEKVKQYYKHTVRSQQYTRWLELAEESYRFYDGNQWTDKEREELALRSQPAITINKVSPKVKALVGIEIESRTRIAYRARTFQPEDFAMSEGLSAYAMQVQDTQSVPNKFSKAFKDGAICGLGWIGMDRDGDYTTIEKIDPFEMGWDVDDTTEDFSDSMYRWRRKWVDAEVLKQQFPDKAKDINSFIVGAEDPLPGQMDDVGGVQPNPDTDHEDRQLFVDEKRNKVRVVALEYKVPVKKYRYFTNAESPRQKEVLSLEVAEKEAKDPKQIETVDGFRVNLAVFTGSVLLYHAPLPQQIGMFSWIPIVFHRRKQDGVPYGVVEGAKDPQREYNKRRSKMMHLLNTRGLILEGDPQSDLESYRREISRPDPIIVTKPGSRPQFLNNLQLADGQFRVMNQASVEIQEGMGISNEIPGSEDSNLSGAAILRRQQSSVRTHTLEFDNLRNAKKNFGIMLLAYLQATADENFMISIVSPDDPQKAQSVILNEPYEVDGKTVYKHDLNTFYADVVVEEIEDYSAPPGELRDALIQLLGNGQVSVLTIPELARQLGVKNADKIAPLVQQLLGASPVAQGASTEGGPAVPPNLPQMGGNG